MRCLSTPLVRFLPLLAALLAGSASAAELERIEDFDDADNPGRIDMYRYVPATAGAGAPLIITLHGCGQSAAEFAQAGWIDVADRSGALLLAPQQRRRNSFTRCWNWFIGDSDADNAEMRSILAMIERMRADFAVDPGRAYVAGLSAGGWMSSLLLAAHPALFAGGAVFAAGPAYCAFSARPWWDPFGVAVAYWAWPAAFNCMAGIDLAPADWAQRAREHTATAAGAALPPVSIWHGSDDDTVGIANVREFLEQWTALAGADDIPDVTAELVPGAGAQRRVYTAGNGGVVLETVIVEGMGHAIPIDPRNGCGTAGAYVEDRELCAAMLVGRFWNLPGS